MQTSEKELGIGSHWSFILGIIPVKCIDKILFSDYYDVLCHCDTYSSPTMILSLDDAESALRQTTVHSYTNEDNPATGVGDTPVEEDCLGHE